MQLARIQPKEPTQKVSLAFKESTVVRLQAYCALYAQTYQEDVTRQDVVEHMLNDFMNKDKTFRAFEKNYRAGQPAGGKPAKTAGEDASI